METASDAKIRVLHVDDEPGFADLVAEQLQREEESLSVETATGVDAGLEFLDEADIDCIVSDFDMPRRNGMEFLEVVRETYAELPFILYTGKGSEEIASKAIAAGVDDYLQKSPGKEQYTLLAKRITNAVEKYRYRKETAQTRRFFSKLIQHSTDVIPVIGAEGTLKYISPSCEVILGYEQEEVIGEDVWDYIHPDDLDKTTEKFMQTVENPDIMPEVNFRFKHADGSWVSLHGRAKNLLDDPDVEGVVSYNRIVEK